MAPSIRRTASRPLPASSRPSAPRAFALALAVVATAAIVAACGGGSDAANGTAQTPASLLSCDDSMKTAFKPDADTSVVLVKAFKQGDPLALPGTTGTPPAAAADLCLVKMVVGPGFADAPAGAPSSSAGIGIEIWLPSTGDWNQRIRNLGGGGWAGGNQSSTVLVGSTQAAAVAATGYVAGTTDTGHAVGGTGAFAMRQDGGINSTLWTDFAQRSLHELAVKSKALARAYYGSAQQYAYWEGCSTGGRQGYKIAQEHPDDYDGYLVGAPAFNWTRFITSELYPQIVMQQDLGAPMATAKLSAMSGAAVSACDVVGGQHLGFVLDPGRCRYDPTRDAAMLCAGEQGNGVVGASVSPSCASAAEARAMNKIWYGQTADGTSPDPAQDNGSTATLSSGNHLWWGLTRGTNVNLLAGAAPFTIATDMVALELQDPTHATPSFVNATGNGADKWRQMTYVDLANAYHQGVALQPYFGSINTDNADLRKARDGNRKILSYHGLADTLITPQGSVNYYTRVSQLLGGNVEVNKFNRLFLVPGMGHCAGVGSAQASAGPAANANSVPLPVSGQLFGALVDWVEKADAPASIVLTSADASVSMPVCPYPQKATYVGSGSPRTAASYACR